MLAVARTLGAQSDAAYVDPVDIAVYYGRADQVDLALDWLERAVGERGYHLQTPPSP
jgi:hypothetical protein